MLASTGRVSPCWDGAGPHGGTVAGAVPRILRLPDWLFRRVARRMLAIDPEARSSMWEDLDRRRRTEVDDLQGAILALAWTGSLLLRNQLRQTTFAAVQVLWYFVVGIWPILYLRVYW